MTLLAALGLALLALAACGPSSPTASTTTTSTGATGKETAPLLVAGHGGTATVAVDAVPTTLNDHTVAGDTEATRLVASAVWVQVFQIANNLAPVLDTDVMESAEVVSVNPQTVVYQISPKAVWSDGTPVTAADFQYAWQSQRGGATDVDGTPDSVASTLGYRDISSVTSSNHGRTVTVVFHSPDADWKSLFDDLLPAHVAERVGWNNGFDHFDPSVLVSAGPWLIKSWDPGARVVLVRNPHWWGTPTGLGRIVVEAVTDPSTLVEDVRTRRVQVIDPTDFDASFMSQLSALPRVETQTNLGTTMLQLEFNVRHAPLDSPLIRQGIAHVIDRVGIVTKVTQPLDQDAWMDNNHLFANTQSMYNDDGSGYEIVDPGAADALFTQGGFVSGPDHTWTFHGAPVTLDLTWADDDPWSEAVGPLVASQLVGAGLDVDATPVPMSDLMGTVLPGATFDLAIVPMGASAYPSALDGAFSPTAAAASPGLAQDWSGFDDPEVDSLMTQAAAQLSVSQAGALYQQIDDILWQEMPTLPLLAEPSLMAYSVSLLYVNNDPGGLGVLWDDVDWRPLVATPPVRAKTQSG